MDRYFAYLIITNLWIVGSFITDKSKSFMLLMAAGWLIMTLIVYWTK